MALVPCVDCGKEISTIAIACPNCGRPVDPQQVESADTVNVTTDPRADSIEIAENELSPTEPDVQEAPRDLPEQKEMQYEGIGGWLTLFLMGLLVFRPFRFCRTQADLANVPIDIVNIFNRIAYVDLGIGFIVAFLLLCKLRIAPRIAQVYLAALVIFNIIYPFLLPSILGRAIPADQISRELIGQLILSIPAVIWLIYFSKSKRVKATYYSSE